MGKGVSVCVQTGGCKEGGCKGGKCVCKGEWGGARKGWMCKEGCEEEVRSCKGV